MNPFDALASLVIGKIKEGIYARWLTLLFEMFFSATVSFLFTCGSMLTATRIPSISIGSGMVMAGICLTVLYRRSPLTKGMLVVLPGSEATGELASDLQVIEKSK